MYLLTQLEFNFFCVSIILKISISTIYVITAPGMGPNSSTNS